jgi:hypothetical protein
MIPSRRMMQVRLALLQEQMPEVLAVMPAEMLLVARRLQALGRRQVSQPALAL